MKTFLFWNINNKPLDASIKNLVELHNVDVLMLAESCINPANMLYLLNPVHSAEYYFIPQNGCTRIQIFTKFPEEFFESKDEEFHYSVRHLKLPNSKDFLIAIFHFPSKREWKDEDQDSLCNDWASVINSREDEVGHSRTILVGDFNMNPFQNGMINATGFHGMISRRMVEEEVFRTINGKKYRYFYNPMWRFFSDKTSVPPGTHFYRKAVPVHHFWNIFDQVLLRPDVLPFFKNDKLQILVTDGEKKFLDNKGRPDSNNYSDHLPILFKLNI